MRSVEVMFKDSKPVNWTEDSAGRASAVPKMAETRMVLNIMLKKYQEKPSANFWTVLIRELVRRFVGNCSGFIALVFCKPCFLHTVIYQ
jgi:hypothetical protein